MFEQAARDAPASWLRGGEQNSIAGVNFPAAPADESHGLAPEVAPGAWPLRLARRLSAEAFALARLHLPAVLLWGTGLVAKLATFVFGFKVGRCGGVEALGAMAAFYLAVWIVGSTASLGLPDWAVFRAARDRARDGRPSAQLGVGHGLFLVLSGAAYLLLFAAAPALGGVSELGGFVRWLALASAFQHFGVYGISCLRGLGRPAAEMAANGGSALILLAGSLWAPGLAELGGVIAVANLSFFGAGLYAVVREPRLRPALRRASQVVPQAAGSLVYLALGLEAYLLGNADLLIARLLLSPAEVGLLQGATVVVRGASAGPWLLATLSLHRLQAAGGAAPDGSNGRHLGPAVALAAAVIVGGWLVLPLIAWGYGIELSEIELPAKVALGTTPLGFAAVMLLPIAALRHSLATVVRAGAALALAALAGLLLAPALGIVGATLAGAAGQAAALIFLWRGAPAPGPGPVPAPGGVQGHTPPN